MKTRFAGTLFGLAVLLLCEVAWAQKVVVLEFEGDRRNRVRLQVVRELLKDGGVELAAVDDFERLAAKKGLKGKRAMTTEAVAAVGVELGVVAALDGDVGRKAFRFRILDGKGTELFAREVPLSKGTLSAKNARRIAAALVAAARTPPRAAPAVAEAAPAQEEESAETPAEAEEATAEVAVPASAREVDRVAEDRRRRDPEYADSHTRVGAPSYEEEFEPVRRRPRGSQVGPKLLTVHLGGTTTWRAYCSRPGVAACGDYDALAVGARPAGDKVDFSPKVPYAGFGIGLDFFPLASMENFAKGFGVNAGFSRGFSLTNVTVETPDGTKSPEKQVVSVDDAWHALLAYRFYFGMGTTVAAPGLRRRARRHLRPDLRGRPERGGSPAGLAPPLSHLRAGRLHPAGEADPAGGVGHVLRRSAAGRRRDRRVRGRRHRPGLERGGRGRRRHLGPDRVRGQVPLDVVQGPLHRRRQQVGRGRGCRRELYRAELGPHRELLTRLRPSVDTPGTPSYSPRPLQGRLTELDNASP